MIQWLSDVLDLQKIYLIYSLVPAILCLILFQYFFKNKFPIKSALRVIRWIVIIYGMISLLLFLYELSFYFENFAAIERMMGSYKFVFWLTILFTIILPFTLLNKRIASNPWWLLLITLFFTAGVYIERLVITLVGWQRDYLSGNGILDLFCATKLGIGLPILQGALFSIVLLFLFKMIGKTKRADRKV